MFAEAKKRWQESSVGDNVPAQCQCDILVRAQTVSIIPEVIFCVHVLEVQHSVFSSQNDLVPQHDLKTTELANFIDMNLLSVLT